MAYRSDIDIEMEARQRAGDGRSVGDLVARLTHDMSKLLVQEIALARAEISEKITQANRGVMSLAIGGAVLYAGLLGVMAALIFALATVMELWAAALIVGLVVGLIGVVLLMVGRNRLRDLELKQTKESLEEDRQWLRHTVKK